MLEIRNNPILEKIYAKKAHIHNHRSMKKWHLQTYLADGFFRRGLSSSGCASSQGCGGLHDGCGHL